MFPIVCDLATTLMKKGVDVYLGRNSETRVIGFSLGGIEPGVVVNVHEDFMPGGMPTTMWVAFDAMEHAELIQTSRKGETRWELIPV
jgi:hypothetical protein